MDNGAGIIVRFTPWNETSSRKRNNIVDELRYLPYFFFFFCYLLRISHLKKREKEQNGKRETIDENFSIHRDNEIDNRELWGSR